MGPSETLLGVAPEQSASMSPHKIVSIVGERKHHSSGNTVLSNTASLVQFEPFQCSPCHDGQSCQRRYSEWKRVIGFQHGSLAYAEQSAGMYTASAGGSARF